MSWKIALLERKEKKMTLDIFLMLLLMVSICTSLATEGLKKALPELGKKYYSNILAGGVAIVISIFVWAIYLILVNATLNAQMLAILIALVFFGWLCAMIGYDKVIQAIEQIIGGMKNGNYNWLSKN